MRSLFYGLSFLLLIVFVFSCSSRSKNECGKLKLGQFHYINKSSGILYTVKRTPDSIQLQVNSQAGDTIRRRVKWTGDCEYVLLPSAIMKTDTANPDRKIVYELPETTISILKVTERYYLYSASVPFNKTNSVDTMWIDGLIGGFKALSGIYK